MSDKFQFDKRNLHEQFLGKDRSILIVWVSENSKYVYIEKK